MSFLLPFNFNFTMRGYLFFFCLLAGHMSGQEATTLAWQDFSFGEPALSVRMPGKPIAQSSRLPQQLLQQIKRYDAHYINDKVNGIVVTVNHVTYTDEVSADMYGAAEGTLGQWRSTGATVEVQLTTQRKVSGRYGLEQQGKYGLDSKDHLFYNLVITDGPRLWQVIIIIRSGDPVLRAALNTMRESIQFKS